MAQQALCFRHAAAGPSLQLRAPAQRMSGRRALSIVAKESRVGKQPIVVPKGVQYKLEGQFISVKGPKGQLEMTVDPLIEIKQQEDGTLRLYKRQDNRKANQLHGLSRSLVNNLFVGTSEGFTKELQMIGVGFRAQATAQDVTLHIGFSDPVVVKVPQGLSVKVEKNTNITVSGFDKSGVGNFAASLRELKKPEPYKGKGIRYKDEFIKLKEGKRGK